MGWFRAWWRRQEPDEVVALIVALGLFVLAGLWIRCETPAHAGRSRQPRSVPDIHAYLCAPEGGIEATRSSDGRRISICKQGRIVETEPWGPRRRPRAQKFRPAEPDPMWVESCVAMCYGRGGVEGITATADLAAWSSSPCARSIGCDCKDLRIWMAWRHPQLLDCEAPPAPSQPAPAAPAPARTTPPAGDAGGAAQPGDTA